MRQMIGTILLVAALVVGLAFPHRMTVAQDEVDPDAFAHLIAQSDEFADWLSEHGDDWQFNAYANGDGDLWFVEYFVNDWSEWLGYAIADPYSGEITESFIPRPLPDEEYDEGIERVPPLVLDDSEVKARLVDPLLWDTYTDYNRFDRQWQMHFYRGADAIVVKVTLDGDNFSIAEIADENQLNEEQATENAQNEAINLAYTADGIDDALDGYDDWQTLVTKFSDTVWSVEFLAGDTELFYALVNLTTDTVLETSAAE